MSLGNKEIMASNIQYYLNARGISRKKLCADTGINYTTLGEWLTAKKYPRIDKIEQLADYFGVSKSDLVERPAKKTDRFLVPVYGRIRGGIPIEAIQEILDYEEITEEMARNGDYIALRVTGDSMAPRIAEGDVVIIRCQPTVENGEIAAVMVNGSDATLKKFYRSGDQVTLVSLNPNYTPLVYDLSETPVSILGRLVELRAKY